MKLVHAADLHVDSPLQGLARYAGAPVERIRLATRDALVNLVDLCIEEEAALLLLAGDIFDGDWKDYSTGLFFAAQMARLKEAGVKVVSIRGNHDAASKMSKKLALPSVHELPFKKPGSFIDETLGLAVHGQGFAKREVKDDIAGGYPDALSGLLNIGLLHTSLDGRPGHSPYAPTTIDVLASKGYDYWALGHVHAREVVRKDPYIVYPGNLQGRHARETGPKGATLITVDDDQIVDLSHRALDVVRWAHVVVDASDLEHPDDVIEATRASLEAEAELASEDGVPRLLAARVTIEGQSAAHEALSREAQRWEQDIRVLGMDIGDAWVEKVRFKTRAAIDLAALAGQDDAIGALFSSLERLAADPETLLAHKGALEDLAAKLPREARQGEDGVRIDDPAYLSEALEDATQLLIPYLLSQGQEPRDGKDTP